MWGEIMNFYKSYIKEHSFAFFLSAGLWLAGLMTGMFFALSADYSSAQNVDLYIQSIINEKSGYFTTLKDGVLNNFWYTLSLCASSSFALFLPCTVFLIAFKGFSTGFTASYIIRLYGLNGVGATLTSVVLPHCFSLPLIFIMYVSCLDFPIRTFSLRTKITSAERWKMYLYHTLKMLVLFSALCVITSTEAFLSPKFFKILAK